MNKFTIILIAILLSALIMITDTAYSQGDSPASTRTVDGRVVSVSVPNSQIVVKTNEDLTFSVPSNAKITNKDGFDIQLSDINAGNYVMVEYYGDASGNRIIKSINVEYNR